MMSFTAKLDGTDTPVSGSPMGHILSIKHPLPNKLVPRSKMVAR
jgi:hypothetical protein